MEEELVGSYTLYSPLYTKNYIMDEARLVSNNEKVLWGFFLTDTREEVTIMIPMRNFFALRTVGPPKMLMFKKANMVGYFNLLPWGVDLHRAWELIKIFDVDDNFCITGLHGHLMEVCIRAWLMRETLAIEGGEVEFSSKEITNVQRRGISKENQLAFSMLNHQEIRLWI